MIQHIKMKPLLKKLVKFVIGLFIIINMICAFQAYKLTHFYDGIGEIKKPEEMGVSDKLSAAVFGVKIYKQKSIDTFAIPHQTITIKTADGFNLESWYATTNTVDDTIIKPKGTVILFHGHGGNKNGVIKEATAFYTMGYNTLLVDFRGHGNSKGNVCTIGYNESKDVKAGYDYIKTKGEQNIIMYGISLGAASILKAIATDSIRPTNAILEMPFGTLFKAVKGRLKIMNLPQQPFATLLTFWGGVEQGFWAFNLQPQQYATAVNCPVLLQWGSKDARVSREETETIFKNLATSNKTFVEYTNSAHQSLCKNENDKWLKTVERFLNK